MKIISVRGRVIRERERRQRELEEQFQVVPSPLTEEEIEHIRKVFDGFCRDLGKANA